LIQAQLVASDCGGGHQFWLTGLVISRDAEVLDHIVAERGGIERPLADVDKIAEWSQRRIHGSNTWRINSSSSRARAANLMYSPARSASFGASGSFVPWTVT
jgi:hypothetical protein